MPFLNLLRCKRWVENCRREDLADKSATHLRESNVLCAIHFEDSQFTSLKKNRIKPLKAVPTLFDVPNPPALLDIKKSARGLPPEPVQPSSLSRGSTNRQKQQHKSSTLGPFTPTTVDKKKMTCLRKKVECQRKMIKRLRAKLMQVPTGRKTAKLEVRTIKLLSAKYLPSEVHSFFCSQLDMSLMKGKRWKPSAKDQALSLYAASPEAYRVLQKQFALPSTRTLRRVTGTGGRHQDSASDKVGHQHP